jgi:hypothetical protein
MDATHVLISVDDRDVRDDAFDARVGGTDRQDVAASVRNTLDADVVRINLGKARHERDRVLEIFDLLGRVDQLTGLALARA